MNFVASLSAALTPVSISAAIMHRHELLTFNTLHTGERRCVPPLTAPGTASKDTGTFVSSHLTEHYGQYVLPHSLTPDVFNGITQDYEVCK